MAKEFVNQEYVAATNGKGLHQESKATRILARTTITGSIIITTISVCMMIFCIIFAMCPVIGTSMMTILNATGKSTDSAITCILGEPKRSEIVVCKLYLKHTRYYHYITDANNGDQNAARIVSELKKTYTETDQNGIFMYIVKRLIGKPGDHISMCYVDNNYYIYLNGEKLDESYLDPLVAHPNAVNFKQLWNVLNRNVYRNYPNQPAYNIDTKANITDWIATSYNDCIQENKFTTTGEGESSRYMLTVPDNCYFLMGDNRGGEDDKFNHSWDSTYFGPLPKTTYVSRCVDIIDNNNTNMPKYLWDKFVYYVCFGWAWQK